MNVYKSISIGALALLIFGMTDFNAEAAMRNREAVAENSSLLGLRTDFPRLFQKFSGTAIPFIIQVFRHPSDSIKERILSVVDQTPVSADMARQMRTNTWSEILKNILKDFFPTSDIITLQEENSALGNLVKGAGFVCAALDGNGNKETAKQGIQLVERGVARLKTEYLRGEGQRNNATPRTYELFCELGQQHQNQNMYAPMLSADSPRQALMKGLRKALLKGYFFKRDADKINEGIDEMIDAVLRLNFQHLNEGEDN